MGTPREREVRQEGANPNALNVQQLRGRFKQHIDANSSRPGISRFGMGLFDQGCILAAEIEGHIGILSGKRILDVGPAYGGGCCALAVGGAHVVGFDCHDYQYSSLRQIIEKPAEVGFVLGSALQPWPFACGSFDGLICMNVLELLNDLPFFFGELRRILKPDGFAVIYSTPAIKCLGKDPIYHIPLIGLAPAPLRHWLGQCVFRRFRSKRIGKHTFYTARSIGRFVRPLGFTVQAHKFCNSPIASRLHHWPLSKLWLRLLRHLAYDYLLLKLPADGSTT